MPHHTRMAAVVLVCALMLGCYAARHDGDAIRLEELQVLTLRHGEMTNARRSSPVPQLKCVGGTAGCDTFRPQVVQCYNRGSDGNDVQWECKTDMDNAYRFGKVQVSCEGYTYPDDPYILKGSCGLEYTLDLTAEGQQQRSGHADHQYYGQPHHHDGDYHDRSQNKHTGGYVKKATSVLGDLMYLAIVAVFIYFIYKKCIATPVHSDDPPPYDETYRRDTPQGNQPPQYGFRQDYMPNTGSCSGGATGSTGHTQPGAGTGGGGFWSGAMTGGLMGYMFGNRNNYNQGYTHQRPGWGWGTGGGWGSGWGSNTSTRTTYGSSTPSAPRSSGTRTASGFGGTSRR